jgi:hypothetical protein
MVSVFPRSVMVETSACPILSALSSKPDCGTIQTMPIEVVPLLESVDEGGGAVKGVFHPFLGGFHPMGKIHESFPLLLFL